MTSRGLDIIQVSPMPRHTESTRPAETALHPVTIPLIIMGAERTRRHLRSQRFSRSVDQQTVAAETTVSIPAPVLSPIQPVPLIDPQDTARITLNMARRPLPVSLDVLRKRIVRVQPKLPTSVVRISQNNISEGGQNTLDKCVEEELQCHICQEVFVKPTFLSCSHTFCQRCIQSWSAIKNVCPLCREPITGMMYCRSIDQFLDKIRPLLSLPNQLKLRARQLALKSTQN